MNTDLGIRKDSPTPARRQPQGRVEEMRQDESEGGADGEAKPGKTGKPLGYAERLILRPLVLVFGTLDDAIRNTPFLVHAAIVFVSTMGFVIAALLLFAGFAQVLKLFWG